MYRDRDATPTGYKAGKRNLVDVLVAHAACHRRSVIITVRCMNTY